MYFLGIDVGGTNIASGVVTADHKLLLKTSRKTHVPCSDEEMRDQFAAAAMETLKEAGLSLHDIPYIGIGCPGTVNRETGIIEFANNLHLNNFPLQKLLENKLGKKVVLENDANAAAYGEYKAGALRGTKNAIAITLGTGIGSGIIIDGKIFLEAILQAAKWGIRSLLQMDASAPVDAMDAGKPMLLHQVWFSLLVKQWRSILLQSCGKLLAPLIK